MRGNGSNPPPETFNRGESNAVRLPSLPHRLAILERMMSESILEPKVAAYRRQAQFAFFCGDQPEELGGYEGQLEVVGRCLEWFVFDYTIAELSATPAQYWFARHAGELTEQQRRDCAECLNFVLGIFEVEQVEKHKGFVAVDLLRTGKTYQVEERVITGEIQSGQLLLSRLFPHRGGYILSGMAAIMDKEATADIKGLITAGKLDPAVILADLDGLELENLFGRSLADIDSSLSRSVLLRRLRNFIEVSHSRRISFQEVCRLIDTIGDPVEITTQICQKLALSCRHEIDLMFAYIKAICKKGNPSLS